MDRLTRNSSTKTHLSPLSSAPIPSTRVPGSSGRVWLAALTIVVLASCERVPTKSDYVSARVTELCEGQAGEELRACRIAVIKQFLDVPLEEMQQRYPKPEPWERPGCGE